MYILFFFSSRRRHTRWPRDWSSDVCSSDLVFEIMTPHTQEIKIFIPQKAGGYKVKETGQLLLFSQREYIHKNFVFDFLEGADTRSEERRVGKGGGVGSWRE